MWTNSFGKRALDVFAAAFGLSLLFPFLLLIAAFIKCSSRGPVLFRQTRMGKGQVPFTIYKFRTMRVSDVEGPLVTRKGDQRMTSAGNILRQLKLDELPQLYNILRGDMSLVGPRPKVVGHECSTLTCRPGMTGAATILFAREEELLAHIPYDEVEEFTISVLHPMKARVDRQYAEASTLWTDLRVMLDTAFRLQSDREITSLEELSAWRGQLSEDVEDVRFAA